MTLPQYHAARWDEPVIFDIGRPGARGQLFPALEPEVEPAVLPPPWQERTAPLCRK